MSTTRTVSDPLSLEDQCLLHLICYLEDYLPETLALLPLHLRHRLLLNIPAADVCRLESTAVSSGIDMEGSIWKVLGDKHRPQKHREHLMTFVFTLMWHQMRNMQKAKEVLFSVKDCLGVTKWEGIQHGFAPIGTGKGHFRYPIPYRYVRYLSVECREIDVISFLVNQCQWMPAQLQISGWGVRTSQLWNKRYRNIMQRLFSQVQEVNLTEPEKQTFDFILKEILSNDQTSLHRLRFQVDYSNYAMASVVHFFSPSNSGDVPPHSHPNIPYNQLSSIAVEICGHGIQPFVNPQLQSVIRYQKALSSVELNATDNLLLFRPTVSMISLLGSLFHQPQFRELTLGNMVMYQDHLSALLPQFLSAPSEEHEQALQLSNISFRGIRPPLKDVGNNPTHETPDNSLPTNSFCGGLRLHVPRKALTLRWPWSTRGVEQSGLHMWLSAYNCTNVLSSLTVEGRRDMRYPFKTIHTLCCPNSHTTMLEHLRMHSFNLKLQPSPDQLFFNLFQGPRLKTLHLINCGIGPDGLLPALTQGLRRQISVGSLEDLNLDLNGLGSSPDSDLQEFFDVLFSLPQLSNLQVSLKYNDLQPNHFSLICKSWESKGGQPGMQPINCVPNAWIDIT